MCPSYSNLCCILLGGQSLHWNSRSRLCWGYSRSPHIPPLRCSVVHLVWEVEAQHSKGLPNGHRCLRVLGPPLPIRSARCLTLLDHSTDAFGTPSSLAKRPSCPQSAGAFSSSVSSAFVTRQGTHLQPLDLISRASASPNTGSLRRYPNGGLGLGLNEDNCVTELHPNSPAQQCESIQVDDQLVGVNGSPVVPKQKISELLPPRTNPAPIESLPAEARSGYYCCPGSRGTARRGRSSSAQGCRGSRSSRGSRGCIGPSCSRVVHV